MDLEDSFTEKILTRRKAMAAYISAKKAGTPGKSAQKRAALVEEQQISGTAVSDKVPEESPKRQCIEQPTKNSLETDKENVQMDDSSEDQFIPFKASANRGLAALRRKNNLSDGVEEEETTMVASEPEVNPIPSYIFSTNSSELCQTSGRRARLNDLAANINQWEDDLRPTNNIASSYAANKISNNSSNGYSATSRNVASGGRVLKETGAVGCSGVGGGVPKKRCNVVEGGAGKLGGKIDAWNQAVKVALETEEVSSPVKKVFKFNENDSVKSVSRDLFPKQPTDSNTFSQNILKNKVVPGNNGKEAPSKNDDLNRSLDPAELPLSARKALFEKSLFGAGASRAGGSHSDEQPKLSIAQRAAMFEKAANGNSKPSKQIGAATKRMQLSSPKKIEEDRNMVASPVKASPMKCAPLQASPMKCAPLQASPMKCAPLQASPMKCAPLQASPMKFAPLQASPLKNALVEGSPMKSIQDKLLSPVASPMKEVSSHVRQIQQQLTEQQRTVTWEDEQRKKEVEELANRHQRRQQSSSSSSHHPSGDEQSNSVHEDTGEYYEESASEIESVYTERETEFEDDGKMQEESYEEEYPASIADNQEVFDPEDEEISDYVEPNEVEQQGQSRERKYRQVEYSNPDSDASSLRSSVSVSGSYVSQSPSCSSLSSTGSESRQEAPLQYTVSFYRRQKQASRTPPLRSIVRREQVEPPDATRDAQEQAHIIQDQIKALQEEILRQQAVIGQTSQALNLCHATAEFSGSSEQVEGERLLLIATQKRQACLNEIQRLKSHGAQNGASVSEGMGTLTIADIQLPLKREFITAQLEGKLNDAVHCFLCLIRYGPQVIVTQMMSTSDKISDGTLSFTNHIKLQALPPDFSVVFEVYALQTKKEHLPHDKKYHIRRDQSKIRLTPKGKKGESKLILPAIQSPGGPNTVRSSSFGVVGFTRFSIQNCHKRCFTLDKVPFASPLEGVLKIKLQLHAENKVTQKGFLTMFEVVTGLGALIRRWCYLNAQYLAYWRYPEDEQKKEPIGMIDLKKCVTGEVKLVPRDLCARPHTFELVTVTPRKGEKETGQGNPLSIIKHQLSADTKEERILWCNKLNEALANVRKWDAQALKPVDTDNSDFVYPCSK